MKKLKRIIKYVVIIILTIEIFSFISTPKEIKELQSATKEEKKEIVKKEYKEFLDGTKDVEEYYDTIEEAIKNSQPTELKIYKILKEIEIDDNYIIIGPVKMEDGTEEFSIARSKMKIDENGKKRYSNIINAKNKIAKEFSRESLEMDDRPLAYINFLSSNKVSNLNDTLLIILEEYPGFKWSILALEDLQSLEIQGKRPDEIIPFKMEGETFYFYYYEDLKIEGELKEEDFLINKEDKKK